MRKVTEQSIEAFNKGKAFKKSNTEVEVLPNVTVLKLFGKEIAYRYNNPRRTLSISDGGYGVSKTTSERLNGLEEVNLRIKQGEWLLNGKEWDGSITEI